MFASAHVYPVYPDWLEKLILPLENPQTALAYGKQRGMETTKFSEHMIFQHWFPDHSTNRQDHPFCNNANAAIRRDVWEKHPYDETIPALEDLAWANWALKQGLQIAYVSEAEVIHVHNETWSGVFNRYRREGMAFKRIYPHEKFSLLDLFRLFFVNSINDMKQVGNRTLFLPSPTCRGRNCDRLKEWEGCIEFMKYSDSDGHSFAAHTWDIVNRLHNFHGN